ncbi:hypothetical protein C0993_001276 [Termitomyces sp. T159_Od127]|nr:hypothetical protein C0993_001276 [Termitomyces sp. T159_Od127]
MPSKKQYLRVAAARAHAQALKTRQEPSSMLPIDAEPGSPRTQAQSPIVVDSDSESETAYQGGVNHYGMTSNDETDSQDGLYDGFETVSEFSEEDVVVMAGRKTPYEQIQTSKTAKDWKKAEGVRGLGYNGHSKRNIRYQAQKAQERQVLREQIKTSTDPTVVFMHKYFVAKPASPNTPGISSTNKSSVVEQYTPAELVYFSDDDTGNYEANDKDEGELESDSTESNVIESIPVVESIPSRSRLPIAPPPKRRCLEVPVCEQRQRKQAEKRKDLEKALGDLEKHIKSKKTNFEGGPKGLQSYCALAMQSFLRMVIKNGQLSVDASLKAAESHGFAVKWGGRMLHEWTNEWIKNRTLSQSHRGHHAKIDSVLDDPIICAEMRASIRSNKWSMSPSKLQEFTAGTLVPHAADKYLHHIVKEEMLCGLKKYMELELFPCIQMKVKKGVSIRTAQ